MIRIPMIRWLHGTSPSECYPRLGLFSDHEAWTQAGWCWCSDLTIRQTGELRRWWWGWWLLLLSLLLSLLLLILLLLWWWWWWWSWWLSLLHCLKLRVPQNRWFMRESFYQIAWIGGTPLSGNPHTWLCNIIDDYYCHHWLFKFLFFSHFHSHPLLLDWSWTLGESLTSQILNFMSWESIMICFCQSYGYFRGTTQNSTGFCDLIGLIDDSWQHSHNFYFFNHFASCVVANMVMCQNPGHLDTVK